MMQPFDAVVLSTLLSSARIRRLLKCHGSDEAGETQRPPTPVDLFERIRAAGPAVEPELGQATRRARRALRRVETGEITLLAFGRPGYPRLLAEISDPPPVLWCRGSARVLDMPAVAVVGSRIGSRYACEVAEQLGAQLAARRVTVVSGLARGVDAAAHRGALGVGGPTVAVLGCGLDVVYPPEHGALTEAIVAAGAVVSELDPAAPPRAFHFPLRNRIISGLSLAVVVVEANERSGSLITARCAAEQGREVMAVPGNILTGRCRGGHALIRDGAKVVESADDILEEIRPQVVAASLDSDGVKRGEQEVDLLLKHMDRGESYDLDQLATVSGLGTGALASRVLELELEGRIVRLEGGRFSRS